MLTKTWTDKEREVLIEEIRKRPELYNAAHQDFKNKERRAQSFDEIAQLISQIAEDPTAPIADGRTVSAQWKILKDSFNRTRKAAANSKTYSLPVWRFYRQMEFLTPYTTRYDHFEGTPGQQPAVSSLPNSNSTHYSDDASGGDLDEEEEVEEEHSKASTPVQRFVMPPDQDKVHLDEGGGAPSPRHADDQQHIEVHTPNGSHEIHGPQFMAGNSTFHYRDRFNHDDELNLSSQAQHLSNHILLSAVEPGRKRPFHSTDLCLPTSALVNHASSASASSTNSSASVPFTTTGNLEDYVVDVVKRRVFDAREDDFDLYGRLIASSVREVAHFDQKMWLEMRREIDDVIYKFSKKKFG